MQIITAFKYEKTNADNLGLLPPPTTAKTDAQPTQKRKKISNDKARDSHYKRVLKKADTHEKCQTFFDTRTSKHPHTTSQRGQPQRSKFFIPKTKQLYTVQMDTTDDC